MKEKTKIITAELASFCLILLWMYASASKLFDYERSKGEMFNQALPHALEEILVWALPTIELVTAILLVFKRTRASGAVISIGLLSVFTAYIIAVKLNFFDYVPCSCGGVISKLTWNEHLYFNLVFLVMAIALLITLRQKPDGTDL